MISMVVACCAALLAAVAALFLTHQRRQRGAAVASGPQSAPIPSPFPFYSDLTWVVTMTGDFPDSVKLHARHGPVFWWRFLGRRMLMVAGLEEVNQVLRAEHTTVEAEYPPSVKHMLGRWGLVNCAGKQHIRIKRLAQAAFTPKAIRGYLPRMQASAEEAVRKWADQGDILVYQEMKWWTFRVAVEIILGVDGTWTAPGPDGFAHVSALFKDWLDGLFSFPVAIPGTAFARGMKARAGLMQRIHASMALLEESKAAGAAAKGIGKEEESTAAKGAAAAPGHSVVGEQYQQPTAMDLLLGSRDEEGGSLTREQIADSVLTLLFAGHDTSSTSLTRIFQQLHAHPEAAERLRREQDEVVAKHGTAISEAALEDMRYAEGVIREALRITPIIAGFPRIALQDFELGGHTIPKGARMQCSLAQVLLTDARWSNDEEPLAFKPERWLGGATRKAGAWIPFGGGSRLCLGWLLAMAEMKVLLAVVFRGHSLALSQPDEPWKFFPLARPSRGMPARFARTA